MTYIMRDSIGMLWREIGCVAEEEGHIMPEQKV
jgi:hypothetical protein